MSEYDAVCAELCDLSAATGRLWLNSLQLPSSVLAPFGPDAGPLVDLGAGPGLSTVTLADTAPAAQVYALEPVQAMRAVLISRLVERPILANGSPWSQATSAASPAPSNGATCRAAGRRDRPRSARAG